MAKARMTEEYDYVCSQCNDEDNVVEATAYCPECHSSFCGPCLELHGQLLDHVVLHENRKDDWDKRMDKGITQPKNISETQAKLDQFLESLTKAIAIRSQDEVAWRNSLAQIVDDIVIFRRRKINDTLDRLDANAKKETEDILDKLESKLMKEIEDFDNPFATEITSNLTKYTKIQESLLGYRVALENAEESSIEQQLFIAKLCQKQLEELEQTTDTKLQPIRPKLVFVENEFLLQNIKNATHIGELEVETERTNKAYEVSLYDTKNVNLPGDGSTCFIDGMVKMPNGSIIISDQGNNKLKILDASYNVERYHDVPDKPYAMCRINDQDIVVSIAPSTLLFISIGDTIQNTKSINLSHSCYGLAHHEGKLFVTDKDTSLYIYDLSGTLIRTIKHADSGSNLFAEVRHIAVSPNGSRIYVTDRPVGLIVLDRNGKHMETLSSPDMKGTRGICLDPYGNVFIACCLSHTVVQVHNRGTNVIRTVAEKKDGLHFPGVVLYDNACSCLLVANAPRAGCDSLTVYNIKMK